MVILLNSDTLPNRVDVVTDVMKRINVLALQQPPLDAEEARLLLDVAKASALKHIPSPGDESVIREAQSISSVFETALNEAHTHQERQMHDIMTMMLSIDRVLATLAEHDCIFIERGLQHVHRSMSLFDYESLFVKKDTLEFVRRPMICPFPPPSHILERHCQ